MQPIITSGCIRRSLAVLEGTRARQSSGGKFISGESPDPEYCKSEQDAN